MTKRTVTTLVLAVVAAASPLAAQDRNESVPAAVTSLIGDVYPERSQAGASHISDLYNPNLVITEDTTIAVTILWEGAGYRNSLGYFTYTDNGNGTYTIDSSNLILDNVSFPGAGSLQVGDTYDLRDAAGDVRTFVAGERVGFFVVANGFSAEPLIQNWDPNAVAIPADTPAANALFGYGAYTTIDAINLEVAQNCSHKSRHVSMVKHDGIAGFLGGDDFITVGFEDLNRCGNSDEDFNDCVFVVLPNTASAFDDLDVPTYDPNDADGDGISGLDDAYPNDDTRASVTRIPANSERVIGLEDLYPNIGDADYNDNVISYSFEFVLDENNLIHDIVATFHLMARGAALDHSFGLRIPGIPSSATGDVMIERFLSDEAGTHEVVSYGTVESVIADNNRINDIFESSLEALPPVNGTFTNTIARSVERQAASARVYIEFDTPVNVTDYLLVPYDAFFMVERVDGNYDVHRVGFDSFANRPVSLPIETGDRSFLDANDFPFVLDLPIEWLFMLERQEIEDGYSSFSSWRTSLGSSSSDWYRTATNTSVVSLSLSDYYADREWTIGRPDPE